MNWTVLCEIFKGVLFYLSTRLLQNITSDLFAVFLELYDVVCSLLFSNNPLQAFTELLDL